MDIHVISIAESSHWYQMTDVDRQNKLGFSASAAGRFIFLGSNAGFFNAGSVTGSGEMENVAVELFFFFFFTLDEACSHFTTAVLRCCKCHIYHTFYGHTNKE